MRAALAAMMALTLASLAAVADAKGRAKPAPDPFGELFAPARKQHAASKHHRPTHASRRRGHPRITLVATLVPTPTPAPIQVASNETFCPAEFAPDRHALAGP